MLAYAPRRERRRLQPSALVLIVGAHALAIAAVMTARMEVARHRDPPIVVKTIPLPPEPKPVEPQPKSAQPADRPLTMPHPLVEPPPLPGPAVVPLPVPPDPGPLIGNGMDPSPTPIPVIRTGPRFATPEGDIRPPYPEAMRARDVEATLRLRLAIDERGRVVAVDPVGKVDPAFLAAARRHILKAWRYKPAMAGGKAVAASTVVTLRFELD